MIPQNAINFHELVNENFDIEDVRDVKPDDIAVLPYSSGTTGLPKGVELMHKNLVAQMMQIGVEGIKTLEDATGINSKDM